MQTQTSQPLIPDWLDREYDNADFVCWILVVIILIIGVIYKKKNG